jgi:hypothetical protein
VKINHTAPTPNGKWRWRDPVTGYTIFNFSSGKLVLQIRSYLLSNGREPMSDEQIETAICEQMGLKPPYCDSCSAPPGGLSFDTLKRFFGTVVNWIKSGFKMAPMELVNQRTAVCATCPRNQRAGGCSSCDARLGEIVAQDEELPLDRRPTEITKLHNCIQCGCRLSLKVQFAIEAYADDDAKYPEWCWVTKERHAQNP